MLDFIEFREKLYKLLSLGRVLTAPLSSGLIPQKGSLGMSGSGRKSSLPLPTPMILGRERPEDHGSNPCGAIFFN